MSIADCRLQISACPHAPETCERRCTVNGAELQVPALIVRQWTLRGVAVCPYGMDAHTAAEFGEFALQEKEPEVIADTAPITTTTPAPEMTNDKAEAECARQQLRDYVARFGAELGARWFADAKPLPEAYGEYVAQLQAQHATELATANDAADKLQAKIGELSARLTSLGSVGGSDEPASHKPAADKQPGQRDAGQYASILSPNLARVPAGIKMPTPAS